MRSDQGFTLVEVMVVVALLGILGAIAIPSYKKFQTQARETEIKLALASIYTAETSFQIENSSYSGCLRQLGYIPDGQTRYFFTGFGSVVATASNCGPTGDQPCNTYNFNASPPSTCNAIDVEFGASLDTSDISYAASAALMAQNASPIEEFFLGTNAFALPYQGPRPFNYFLHANITQSTFSAGALSLPGNAGPGLFCTAWSMDQNKVLTSYGCDSNNMYR